METNDRLNPASPDTRQDSGKDSSERRCILSGESAPRTGLIRLALGPDGQVAADWSERLPGRGAWITADKALFDSVAAKGRLRGALARAFKANSFTLPDDLADRITATLQQRMLNRLGLEKRAGTLILGGDRVREALAKGKVFAVLHAGDARPDGSDRIDGMARAVGESLGEDIPHRRVPIARDALSAALGRDNVVHMALLDQGAATRVLADLDRLTGFCGPQTTSETANEVVADATEVALNTGERH
ncbi:DUF448 domain-containing protein [Sandarakinorhabdus limnophila]|jgi:hypothetical protein|uniref:DUF448 domain-containing protein n=1 Tax=Sandarakinorhabdus limnophila TaxID=210512 RepID=UPI0003B3A29C|nr:DUF448 domain-containing protein [Sandarakinorhabdus limnophila]